MDRDAWLADHFEHNRPRLRAVAQRMLGSYADADDAVQEAWLRASRAETAEVLNPAGWLTTIVARVCLNVLASRRVRGERAWDDAVDLPAGPDPAGEAELADTVGEALQVVLDLLPPAERLAFVLHDLFAVPFEEIAPVVDRSPAAARQLASRARRRVAGAGGADVDLPRRRAVVEAFLTASREGDFAALLEVLDPDVVLRADATAVRSATERASAGAPPVEAEIWGAAAVARIFAGRAQAAQPALIDGAAGAAWAPGGTPRALFEMVIVDGRIMALELLAEPELLAGTRVTLLEG